MRGSDRRGARASAKSTAAVTASKTSVAPRRISSCPDASHAGDEPATDPQVVVGGGTGQNIRQEDQSAANPQREEPIQAPRADAAAAPHPRTVQRERSEVLGREMVRHQSIVEDRKPHHAFRASPCERRIRRQENRETPGRHRQWDRHEADRLRTQEWPVRLRTVRQPRAAQSVADPEQRGQREEEQIEGACLRVGRAAGEPQRERQEPESAQHPRPVPDGTAHPRRWRRRRARGVWPGGARGRPSLGVNPPGTLTHLQHDRPHSPFRPVAKSTSCRRSCYGVTLSLSRNLIITGQAIVISVFDHPGLRRSLMGMLSATHTSACPGTTCWAWVLYLTTRPRSSGSDSTFRRVRTASDGREPPWRTCWSLPWPCSSVSTWGCFVVRPSRCTRLGRNARARAGASAHRECVVALRPAHPYRLRGRNRVWNTCSSPA